MTQAVLEGVAFALRDSFEVAKTLGIPIAVSYTHLAVFTALFKFCVAFRDIFYVILI